MNFTLLRFDTLGSTNTEAAEQARRGAGEGVCVIAREQTAGRGRYGRTWFSPPGSGLYLSVVLRPALGHKIFPVITLAAAVAVHDALTELGLGPDIKWPNDVLIDDKKVSGILGETVDTSTGTAVILGIGINLTAESYPAEIAAIATSVETAKGCRVDAAELESALLKYLGYWYDEIRTGDPGPMLDAWRARSSFNKGKAVRVTVPGEVVKGVTDGIEAAGALRVRLPSGTVRLIHAGDVERLRETQSD